MANFSHLQYKYIVLFCLFCGYFGFSPIRSYIKRLSKPSTMYQLKSDSRATLSMSGTESMTSSSTFSALKKLNDQLNQLSARGSEYLTGFWNNDIGSFVIDPAVVAVRPSVVSSCLSIESILRDPSRYSKSCEWSPSSGSTTISLKRALSRLRDCEWSMDAFQTPVLVSTLSRVLPSSELQDDEKFLKAVDTVLSQRARLQRYHNQATSTYFRYLNVKALLDVVNNRVLCKQLHHNRLQAITFALQRAKMLAFDGLCRQVAFKNAGDSQSFDIVVLAYSLLTYIDSGRGTTICTLDSSGRYQASSAGNNDVSASQTASNIKLIEAALAIIFESQNEDGTWSKGEPIEGGTSSSNNNSIGGNKRRDIGNSYVFFVDMLASIIGSVSSEGGGGPELLKPYMSHLQRSIDWVEKHVQTETLELPSTSEVNGFARGTGGRVVWGWRSNHLGSGGPISWCTAQVMMLLASAQSLTSHFLTSEILMEFGGTADPQALPSEVPWKALLDTDLRLPAVPGVTTLKDVVAEKTLRPLQLRRLKAVGGLLSATKRQELQRLQGQRVTSGVSIEEELPVEVFDDASSSAIPPPHYSMILFGPPGTAKTTICTSMAYYLGWNFLTIDTADFLADGIGQVASRMTYIFDRLKVLERTIILFDEVEEFCLDRENPMVNMESRMLTTAMLTQLNDLRRKQKSVFIIATNRLRSFDTAVTRPGRFDMILFVGTPSLAARESRLLRKLSTSPLSPTEQVQVADQVVSFMRKYWTEGLDQSSDAMPGLKYFTFAESEVFLNAIVSSVTRGGASVLTYELLEQQWIGQATTATIKGSVREEYDISEGLSRT